MRFSLGISTPSRRAIIQIGWKESALTLLVSRVRANDTQNSLPLDDAALAAKTFHGWPDFHGKKGGKIGFVSGDGNGPGS